ncbi:hypothetical protein OE88DRAFT_1663004 [Heliocybe sulcata]|uniref:Uncharacterized protein n=1 Tax=Heliocybe sulcata TaxID=5364 RepID=A0A5C3MVC9_9AGAM|nr:hypothetical protein OE88DRAFT_1663004 [Heliocybe sulcata]
MARVTISDDDVERPRSPSKKWPQLTRGQRATVRLMAFYGESEMEIQKDLGRGRKAVRRALINGYIQPDNIESDFDYVPLHIGARFPLKNKSEQAKYVRRYRAKESEEEDSSSDECNGKGTTPIETNSRTTRSISRKAKFQLPQGTTCPIVRGRPQGSSNSGKRTAAKEDSSDSDIEIVEHTPKKQGAVKSQNAEAVKHFLRNAKLDVNRYFPALRDVGITSREALQELAEMEPIAQRVYLNEIALVRGWQGHHVKMLQTKLSSLV